MRAVAKLNMPPVRRRMSPGWNAATSSPQSCRPTAAVWSAQSAWHTCVRSGVSCVGPFSRRTTWVCTFGACPGRSSTTRRGFPAAAGGGCPPPPAPPGPAPPPPLEAMGTDLGRVLPRSFLGRVVRSREVQFQGPSTHAGDSGGVGRVPGGYRSVTPDNNYSKGASRRQGNFRRPLYFSFRGVLTAGCNWRDKAGCK